MDLQRCLRASDLPEPDYPPTDSGSDEAKREFDTVFDSLSDALGKLFLVDDKGGCGSENAVISMSRYVTPCKHHKIVTNEAAWGPDTIKVMRDLLQELPDGWSFGIDATEFPPGQAHIHIPKKGPILGWSEYRARHTLTQFGFPSKSSAWLSPWRFIVEKFDAIRRGMSVRKTIRNNPDPMKEVLKRTDEEWERIINEPDGGQVADAKRD